MKTTKQWLETLPNGLRDTALKQMDECYEGIIAISLSKAIIEFTTWNLTIEGFDFWNCLYEDLKEKGL